MENLSSSKSHLPETGLLDLHRELAQTWGIDFQRVRALVFQLTSSNWCSVSDVIARTLLSHWNVTHLLNAKRNDPLRARIDSSYRVVARERGNATQPGMILSQPARPEEADAVGWLLRALIEHPQAQLVNAWREALIAWGTRQGRHLSKNEARRVIERQRLGMIHAHSYLSELSLSDLRALVTAVKQTLVALDQGSQEEEPE